MHRDSAGERRDFPGISDWGPLKILVIHESPVAADTLCDWIRSVSEAEVVANCLSAIEAVNAINRLCPDLLFLDVNLPGVDVLAKLGRSAKRPLIVYVLGRNQALRCFSNNDLTFVYEGSDYKNSGLQELFLEVRKRLNVGKKQGSRMLGLVTGESVLRKSKNLAFRVGRRFLAFPVEEVSHIASEERGTTIHTTLEAYVTRYPLSSFTSGSNKQCFFRANRSTIVNLHAIRGVEITIQGKCSVEVANGLHINISRARAVKLSALLHKQWETRRSRGNAVPRVEMQHGGGMLVPNGNSRTVLMKRPCP
jgi:two-component system LytT family response regulator